MPILCTPLFLLPQAFLAKPAEDYGLDRYATTVLGVYDFLALQTMLRCPLHIAIRAIIRTICCPRLAEVICLHVITSDCPAIASGSWLAFDWTSLFLLQAQLAVIFLSTKHNFTKVKPTQLNFIPIGFAVCVFGKAAHLRLLGLVASLRLISQVTF